MRFDTWGNYILTGVGNEQVSDEEDEPDEGTHIHMIFKQYNL